MEKSWIAARRAPRRCWPGGGWRRSGSGRAGGAAVVRNGHCAPAGVGRRAQGLPVAAATAGTAVMSCGWFLIQSCKALRALRRENQSICDSMIFWP